LKPRKTRLTAQTPAATSAPFDVTYHITPAPDRDESNSAMTDGADGAKESKVRLNVVPS
jgi:hypothetical protein